MTFLTVQWLHGAYANETDILHPIGPDDHHVIVILPRHTGKVVVSIEECYQ